MNHISMKKYIETINKSQEEMKNTISELRTQQKELKPSQMKQKIKSESQRTWQKDIFPDTATEGRLKTNKGVEEQHET